MEITHRDVDGVIVFSPVGSIDANTAPAFSGQIDRAYRWCSDPGA